MKNRKRGLNSPNKLFADWIIHRKYGTHLEGLDSVCQPTLCKVQMPQKLHFLRHHFGMLLHLNFHLESDECFEFRVPDGSQYLMLEGSPQWKSCKWFISSQFNKNFLALGRNYNIGFFIAIFLTWQIFQHVSEFLNLSRDLLTCLKLSR